MVVGGEGESGRRRRAGERRGGASAGSLMASVCDFAQLLASSAHSDGNIPQSTIGAAEVISRPYS